LRPIGNSGKNARSLAGIGAVAAGNHHAIAHADVSIARDRPISRIPPRSRRFQARTVAERQRSRVYDNFAAFSEHFISHCGDNKTAIERHPFAHVNNRISRISPGGRLFGFCFASARYQRRAVCQGERSRHNADIAAVPHSTAVNFRFDPQGGAAFGRYTAENIGSPFAIVLDEEVISAPVIQSHIPGGTGIITGNFTPEESARLAILLRAGALPAEITVLEQRTIGPELGQDSIEAGRLSAGIALAAVAAYTVASYGAFGVIACVALLVNMTLIFALMTSIGATLTMPGIAGVVLTIGMAVDSNVLIFERIREELRTAKGPARAIRLGFEKALTSIVDANITTLIVAVILYALGSGPVRGFAVTLALGIVCTVFTAVYVTQVIVAAWFEWRRPKTVTV